MGSTLAERASRGVAMAGPVRAGAPGAGIGREGTVSVAVVAAPERRDDGSGGGSMRLGLLSPGAALAGVRCGSSSCAAPAPRRELTDPVSDVIARSSVRARRDEL